MTATAVVVINSRVVVVTVLLRRTCQPYHPPGRRRRRYNLPCGEPVDAKRFQLAAKTSLAVTRFKSDDQLGSDLRQLYGKLIERRPQCPLRSWDPLKDYGSVSTH